MREQSYHAPSPHSVVFDYPPDGPGGPDPARIECLASAQALSQYYEAAYALLVALLFAKFPGAPEGVRVAPLRRERDTPGEASSYIHISVVLDGDRVDPEVALFLDVAPAHAPKTWQDNAVVKWR